MIKLANNRILLFIFLNFKFSYSYGFSDTPRFLKWVLDSTVLNLKKYNCIVVQILHINNYLILPEAKVEKMGSYILSEKVVIEISALKVRVFG